MARRNTRNLNMPPCMYPRTQRSGRVYYMYTKDKPHKEIPLGRTSSWHLGSMPS